MFGVLYTVATPIGNLQDISFRAINVLKNVDLIAAEDTRHSQTLLNAHGINTSTISLHEHNEKKRAVELIQRLKQGSDIALISDAGTPLISDPGCHLIRMAHESNINVIPIPGPCALISALSASGFKANKFIFEGFLPPKVNDRQKQLMQLQLEPRTLLFYETPHRIVAALEDMAQIFGEDRSAVMAREITKRFETIKSAPLGELATWVKNDPQQQKGEFVVIVEGCTPQKNAEIDEDIIQMLSTLVDELPINQAVKLAAKIAGAKKNQLYQLALEMKDKG